jgi:hypothetical protein
MRVGVHQTGEHDSADASRRYPGVSWQNVGSSTDLEHDSSCVDDDSAVGDRRSVARKNVIGVNDRDRHGSGR